MDGAFDLALWLAGLGHFAVLGASFQVPARLGWREELARLRPLNRKLMWTYGGFTVLTIVAFGTLTLALRAELLHGDRAAIGLAAFVGIYWAARIVVDLLYFGHTDWPPGGRFVIGHALLMGLFVFLAATYLGLVVWHVVVRAAP
jgi:alginate O-acetyltransferase complex protein AlgI